MRESESPASDIVTCRLIMLPDVVVLPGVRYPSSRLFQLADLPDNPESRLLGVVFCKTVNPASGLGDPFDIGCTIRFSDNLAGSEFIGDRRFEITSWGPAQGGPIATIRFLEGSPESEIVPESVYHHARSLFLETVRMANALICPPIVLPDLPETQTSPSDAAFLSYQIAAHLRGSLVLRQQLLALPDTITRLTQEIDILKRLSSQLAVRCQVQKAFLASDETDSEGDTGPHTP